MKRPLNDLFGIPRKTEKDPKELAIVELSKLLKKKAEELVKTKGQHHDLFSSEESVEWLQSEIDQLLELDEWHTEDLARLSALAFFFMTTPDEE